MADSDDLENQTVSWPHHFVISQPAAERPRSRDVVLFFGGLGILLCLLILVVGLEGRQLTHKWFVLLTGGVCGLTTLGILIWAVFRCPVKLQKFFIPVLSVLCVLSSILFFSLSPRIDRDHYISGHDSMHYLLGAKYYPELQYVGLYECIAVADREGRQMLLPGDYIRDLKTYKFVTIRSIFTEGAKRCKQAFTAERWESFKSDTGQYQDILSRKGFLRAIADHGYNGTPFLAVVAGSFANLLGDLTYTRMMGASLVDILGLLAMFAAITLAYGWRWGLIVSIFFTTAFTDRFFLIGGSFLRYWWMIPLGIGMAALHRGRHVLAGVCITLAGMLNVFPILFSVGLGVRMLDALIRKRQLSRAHARYLVASVVTVLLCLALGAINGQTLGNYTAFLTNMEGHTDLVTNSRIGFRYLFLFRGEIFQTDPVYPIALKEAELQNLMPYISILAWLVIAACAWVVRRLDDVRAALLLGMTAFFFLFGTVGYYFGVYALLLLLWVGHLNKPYARMLFCAQWLLMLLVHFAWLATGSSGFVYNTVFSLMFAVLLIASIIYFALYSKSEPAYSEKTAA